MRCLSLITLYGLSSLKQLNHLQIMQVLSSYYFPSFFGIGFSFITYLYRKENVRYLGLLDGLYLTSVFYMLRQLPLIHPRIHQALSTVSSIIKASSAYSANFQKAAGITVKNVGYRLLSI